MALAEKLTEIKQRQAQAERDHAVAVARADGIKAQMSQLEAQLQGFGVTTVEEARALLASRQAQLDQRADAALVELRSIA